MKTKPHLTPPPAAEMAPARAYQRQLAQLTQAMAQMDSSEMEGVLAAGSTPEWVQFFIEGNIDKRFEKLEEHLAFVAEAFADFSVLIGDYMQAAPPVAYDTAISDAERMLEWLSESNELTPAQSDYAACQKARHAVEDQARAQRLLHVRFQEKYSLIDRFLQTFDETSELRLYLNPIRCWATFISDALLEKETKPPAKILFFPRSGEISSAVLELEGQALINELTDFQPCTLGEWAAVSCFGDRAHLCATIRELAAMGLIALG